MLFLAKARDYCGKIWHSRSVQDAVEQGVISAVEALTIRILVKVGCVAIAGSIATIIGAVTDAVWHLS
jgi:hypothetical protein